MSDWKCIRSRHVMRIKNEKAGKEEMVKEILSHFEKDHNYPKFKSAKILANVRNDLKKRSNAKKQKKGKGKQKKGKGNSDRRRMNLRNSR